MDNSSDHDTDEVNDWFEEHPRWTRHFTPKHASWLNQIEPAFGQIQQHVLTRESWPSVEALQQAIYCHILWRNQHARPFHWSYRPKSWSRHLAALVTGGSSAAQRCPASWPGAAFPRYANRPNCRVWSPSPA